MDEARPDPSAGRHETELERTDRNLVELLQEVRVVQTGVQILFRQGDKEHLVEIATASRSSAWPRWG